MKIKLGIVMNPLKYINIQKDSSIAILLAAQKKKYNLYYINADNLFTQNDKAFGITQKLKLNIKNKPWFELKKKKKKDLSKLQVILMRLDPPINMNYIYITYILEKAEKNGTIIINKPKSLRDYNEKIFTLEFKKIIPKTIITKKYSEIKKFYKKYKDIIVKPLNQMGGRSIFRIQQKDKNYNVIIETMTNYETIFCIIQEYLPNIKFGDKRIILINGHIIPWVLYRIPKKKENRGNLATGGLGIVKKITNIELKIAQQISPILKKKKILIAGIDIIGNKLTEINITSPTGICEIEKNTNFSITKIILDMIKKKCKNKIFKKNI